MINFFRFDLSKASLILISALISSCSSIKTETKRSDINDIIYSPHQQTERKLAEQKGGTILGNIFGINKGKNSNSREIQVSVNPYLWKASLNILSAKMPLASVDSNSGIIITDWYSLKSKNNERVKITVLINSIDLRADGVKVSIFKQIKNANTWNDAKVNPNIVANLERKIIRQAGLLANASN